MLTPPDETDPSANKSSRIEIENLKEGGVLYRNIGQLDDVDDADLDEKQIGKLNIHY
jgi:hypothetical protein